MTWLEIILSVALFLALFHADMREKMRHGVAALAGFGLFCIGAMTLGGIIIALSLAVYWAVAYLRFYAHTL